MITEIKPELYSLIYGKFKCYCASEPSLDAIKNFSRELGRIADPKRGEEICQFICCKQNSAVSYLFRDIGSEKWKPCEEPLDPFVKYAGGDLITAALVGIFNFMGRKK